MTEARTVRSTGATIYYEVYGEGPPVLIAPGAEESPMHFWQNIPALVLAGYQVIPFSLRGHYNAPCSPGFAHPRYFIDDALAILEAEGIPRAAFICESMGGFAGMPLAAKHPERVSALILMGSTAAVYSEQNYQVNVQACDQIFASLRKAHPRTAWGLAAPGGELDFLDYQVTMLSSPDGIVTIPTLLLHGMLDLDIWLTPDDLRGYAVPTLIVGGDQDTFLGEGFQRHLVTLIPGAELSDLQETGHRPFWTHPERFNQVAIEFLKKSGW